MVFGQVRVNRGMVSYPAMKTLGTAWQGVAARARRHDGRAWLLVWALILGALAPVERVSAAPFIWDQDGDRIDDRIENVNLLGYHFAFENGDSLLRQRFQVTQAGGSLVYGVYVDFKQTPTASDLSTLAALGMPVLHRYEEIPTVRSVATFAQLQAASALPSVERIEAVPLLYPVLHEGAAAIGVRDPSEQVFPTWQTMGGATGQGVVVAILDTGINDEAEGSYPGHES